MSFLRIFHLILLAMPIAAQAYVPPSEFQIKEMAKKRAGFKGVRIRSLVQGLKDGKTTGVSFKETTVLDFATRTLRSHAQDLTGKDLYGIERKLDGAAEAAKLPTKILLDSNAGSLAIALKAIGVPIRTEIELLELKTEDERQKAELTSIKRLDTKTAWVIGRAGKPLNPEDRSPEDPQIWIEKDAFLPIRLVLPGPNGGLDIRLDGFRYYKEFPYPKTVESASVRDELIDLAVNPDSTELKASVTLGYTEAGNQADSGVRDLIQQYYDQLR